MADKPGRQMFVLSQDTDFIVRRASFDDLVRIQRDAQASRLNARWSSEDELRKQVAPDSSGFLVPFLRNGGPVGAPPFYRCYIYFALKSDAAVHVISCIDVKLERLESLSVISSSGQLKEVIRKLLVSSVIARIW